MPKGTPVEEILRSWKEIAAYIGRDVRTAIRWEKDRGLPVRRPPGSKKSGSVFAYRGELDKWMMGDGARPQPESSASKMPAELAAGIGRDEVAAGADVGTRVLRSEYRRSAGLAGVGVLALCALAIVLTGFAPTLTHRGLELPLQFVRTDYSPGENPTGMVVADFDNNGIPDLVVANAKENSLAVFLGQGNGMFAQPIKVTGLAEYPTYFAVADFNGDGNMDVALQTKFGASRFHVLLGDGRGHLRQASVEDLPGGNKGSAVGDVNHDGKADVAVVLSFAKKVVVLLSNGDGSFRRSAELESPTQPGPVAMGEFNGDGNPDLVVCDFNVGMGKAVTVYLGKGDGTFPTRRVFRTGGGPLHVAVADVNEDGKLDIVTADFQAGVSVLLGNGDGTFREPAEFEAGKANTNVAVTDLDQDGRLDILALGMHDDALVFLRGHGDGKFDGPQKIPTGRYPDVIAVADFDGDGLPDVAVTNTYAGSLSVYLNRSRRRSSWGR